MTNKILSYISVINLSLPFCEEQQSWLEWRHRFDINHQQRTNHDLPSNCNEASQLVLQIQSIEWKEDRCSSPNYQKLAHDFSCSNNPTQINIKKLLKIKNERPRTTGSTWKRRRRRRHTSIEKTSQGMWVELELRVSLFSLLVAASVGAKLAI